MATTSELLTPISSRSMVGSSVYYLCRRSSPLSTPWPFNKRAYKRHSSTFSVLDKTILGGEVSETISLPSSPLIVDPSNKNMNALWDDIDCKGNFRGVSSNSLGYFSRTSERSTPLYHSSSDNSSHWPHSNYSNSEESTAVTIPLKFKSKNRQIRESNTELENKLNNTLTVSTSSHSSELVALQPTALSSKSTLQPNQSHTENLSARLTSIPVPSKRSTSESSSSSSGSTSADESPRRRVKDDEGFIRRASCVCVNEDESKVILISSKSEGGGWLIPGGGLESGEGEEEAAVREAWEEAGIVGEVKRCLGTFQSEDEATHKKKKTTVYVLSVAEQHSVFPEASLGRVREWFHLDEAAQKLSQSKRHQLAYLSAL